jgi:hypothetical protein
MKPCLLPEWMAQILTESPAGGSIRWSVCALDKENGQAELDIGFECPGLDIACRERFPAATLAEFRTNLAALLDRRSETCGLQGFENNFHCQFERISIGSAEAIYFSLRFDSVVPVDSNLLRLGRPHGTRVDSRGIRCGEDLQVLLHPLEEVVFALQT